MSIMQLCHVQNFIKVLISETEWSKTCISIKTNFEWKNISEMVPRTGPTGRTPGCVQIHNEMHKTVLLDWTTGEGANGLNNNQSTGK